MASLEELDDLKEGEEEQSLLDPEILNSSTRDIIARRRLLENDMRIMKSEHQRLTHEKAAMHEKIKDNQDKIENNRYVQEQSLEEWLTLRRQTTTVPCR